MGQRKPSSTVGHSTTPMVMTTTHKWVQSNSNLFPRMPLNPTWQGFCLSKAFCYRNGRCKKIHCYPCFVISRNVAILYQWYISVCSRGPIHPLPTDPTCQCYISTILRKSNKRCTRRRPRGLQPYKNMTILNNNFHWRCNRYWFQWYLTNPTSIFLPRQPTTLTNSGCVSP